MLQGRVILVLQKYNIVKKKTKETQQQNLKIKLA